MVKERLRKWSEAFKEHPIRILLCRSTSCSRVPAEALRASQCAVQTHDSKDASGHPTKTTVEMEYHINMYNGN